MILCACDLSALLRARPRGIQNGGNLVSRFLQGDHFQVYLILELATTISNRWSRFRAARALAIQAEIPP
jgi:hypothetical protein